MQIVLAVSAPGSGIAGIWFMKTAEGRVFWESLTGLASVVAVVQPLLGLTRKIREFETLVSGYRVLEFDLRELTARIRQSRAYTPKNQAEVLNISARERHLIEKCTEPTQSPRLKRHCEQEVNEEFPANSFYVPET
jgi:hypothetical protein